jgi:hypothetical protein
VRRRHGWLTEDEVVLDAEMRGERKPEIGGWRASAVAYAYPAGRGWPVAEDVRRRER